MLSILWPVHDTYRHRTHQYMAQRIDLYGSKTSTLNVCIHANAHILHSCILINFSQECQHWASVGAVGLRQCTTSQKVAGSIPDSLLEFFIDIILPAALWPGFDSTSSRNEYLEYFLMVKSGRHTVTVSKSGSLKHLETSWPVTGLESDCFTSTSYWP